MSVGLQIDVRDAGAQQLLDRFFATLTDRTGIHEHIGERASELTRSHLVAIAQSRHKTAQKLGATPSGFWGQGAEKTTSVADAEKATVTINQPGIGRAAHDVDILPGGGKKYLTLPAIAAAYNKKATTVPDLTMMIRWKDGQRRAIALGQKAGEQFTVWYWLVKSVRQKQDRTLLPSDEEFRLAALAGIRDSIDALLAG